MSLLSWMIQREPKFGRQIALDHPSGQPFRSCGVRVCISLSFLGRLLQVFQVLIEILVSDRFEQSEQFPDRRFFCGPDCDYHRQ